MPIVCPDLDILAAWRDTMTDTSACLLLIVPLIVPLALALIARARPAGRRPWLLSSLSALFALGVGVASLVLSYQLNHALAVVGQWFTYDSTRGCMPVLPRFPSGYVASIEEAARQVVDPLERLAQLDIALAILAFLALLACVLIWARRRAAPEVEPAAA